MGVTRIIPVGADRWRVEEDDGPFSGASVQPSDSGMRLPEWMVMPARSGSIVDGSIFASLAGQVAERFYQHVSNYLVLLAALKLFTKPEDGALVYMARHVDPTVAITSDTITDLDSLAIADDFFPDFIVNGKKLMPKERTLQGLIQFLADLHEIFSKQRHVHLTIDGTTLDGEVKELGRGHRAVVYAIGDDRVIKIPHPTFRATTSLLLEALAYDFWKYQSLVHPFGVVPMFYTHPLGLFSVRGRAEGKTLEHYLDFVSRHPRVAMVASKREAVWEIIDKILQINRKFPWLTLHVFPDNLHLVFDSTGNPYFTLIDFGPPVRRTPTDQIDAEVVKSCLGFWPFGEHESQITNPILVGALQALGLPVADITGNPAILLSSIHLATDFAKYLELADLRRQKKANQTAQTLFQGIEIAEGDVIALSNRDGVSPFIIQLADLSPLDHIGVVVKINGEWFVAHYTNEKKYHLQPLEKFSERVVRKQLQYVVGRISSELNPNQKARLSSRAQSLVDEQANIQGLNCATVVHILFESMGLDVGARHHYTTLNVDAMGGVLKSIMHYIPDAENGYTPFSIMEMLNIVGHNFADPEKMVRWTEDDFFAAWEREGDVTHIARFLGAHLVHADATSPSLQRYMRMVTAKLAAKAMEPDAVPTEPRTSGVGQGEGDQEKPEAALATHGPSQRRTPVIRHSLLVRPAIQISSETSVVQSPPLLQEDLAGKLLDGLTPRVGHPDLVSAATAETAHEADGDELAGGEIASTFAAARLVPYHHVPMHPLGQAARPIALARSFLGH